MRQTLVLCAAVGFLLFSTFTSHAADAPKSKGVTEADVLTLLQLKIKPEAILEKVAAEGVDPAVDDAALERLKKAGASDKLLAGLKKARETKTTGAGAKLKQEWTFRNVRRSEDLGFDAAGKTLIAKNGNKAEIWDLVAGEPKAAINDVPGGVGGVAITPDGKIVAVGGDKRILLCDAESGKEIRTIKLPNGRVESLFFLADGKQLLSGSSDRVATLWDTAKGTSIAQNAEMGNAGFHISPDGKYMATILFLGVGVFDLSNLKQLTYNQKWGGWNDLGDISFSSDSRKLVVGARSSVYTIAIPAFLDQKIHAEHAATVSSAVLSPDGKYLASGSEDKTVILWDLKTRKERATLKGHEGATKALFSTDGKSLFTHGTDGSQNRVWDVESGQEKTALEGHKEKIRFLVLAPDGSKLISVGVDGEVKLWDLSGEAGK